MGQAPIAVQCPAGFFPGQAVLGFVQAVSALKLQKTKNKTKNRVQDFAPSRAVQ